MRQLKLNDPDLPLENLMKEFPDTIAVFMRHKMLCVGCYVNPFHTVLDACLEYGLDIDTFYAELAASIRPAHLKA